MKYLSVCAGIEAASVAWHHMGWEPVAFSEIEKFPSAVLAHHYPNVPNWGDMTKFKEWPDANIDVLVGGTPCQSFSVAGLRKGLDDPRGNLMLTFGSIAQRYRPQWLVWENVPGVLSSNGGRDFGSFLGMLGQLGYGFAYRVLDAQYFGVAQRRRRVFVVGHLGDWHRAAAVLFERHSLSGHPAPSRQARKGTASGAASGTRAGGWPAEVSPTLNACFGSKQGQENQHINGGAGLFVPVAFDAFNQADTGDLSKTVAARNDQDTASLVSGCWWDGEDVAPTLTKQNASGAQRMPDKANFGAVLQPVAGTLGNRGLRSHTELDGHGAYIPVMQPISFPWQMGGTIQMPVDKDISGSLIKNQTMAVAIQGTVIGRSETAGPQGSGADASGAMFTLTKTDVHAVAVDFRHTDLTGDVTHTIQAKKTGGFSLNYQPGVMQTMQVASVSQSLYDKGIRQGDDYASAQETDAGALLRVLQNSIGEEAFTQWGLGILDSLQSPEVLQQALHGLGVRPATFSRRWVVYCSLSREKSRAKGVLQSLREAECERCSPQGWQPSQQCLDELGAYLSQLSQPGAQAARFLHDLWQAAKGTGVLQQALLAIQNVGRPGGGDKPHILSAMQVRRLTPVECERLQGFPDGYTNIPWRGKPESPDGPRYKALGNSMAVPVMSWIGERINEVSKL